MWARKETGVRTVTLGQNVGKEADLLGSNSIEVRFLGYSFRYSSSPGGPRGDSRNKDVVAAKVGSSVFKTADPLAVPRPGHRATETSSTRVSTEKVFVY